MSRDFVTVWVLPVAVLLPPAYAFIAPFPLYLLTWLLVFRGVVHRGVFTAGAVALGYGAASYLFRLFPVSFAGPVIGAGRHAMTWVVAVIVAEQVARRWHQFLIVAAVKMSNPSARVLRGELTRESLLSDFTEFDLGVVVTILIAVSAALAMVAVPLALLARRFMFYRPLRKQATTDSKTGLLNAGAWETGASAELARVVKAGREAALLLIDIDHFKRVNDTHGHLAGDAVLVEVTSTIRDQLRASDVAGRFGGEEFVVLLPDTGERQAERVAERIREHIADLAVPLGTGAAVRLTVSAGIAALHPARQDLKALLAAADAALYQAKSSGRNMTLVSLGAASGPPSPAAS